MKIDKGFEGLGNLLQERIILKPVRQKSKTHFLCDEVCKVCGKPTNKNEWGMLLAVIKRIGQNGVYEILGKMKEGKVNNLKLFVWLSRGR